MQKRTFLKLSSTLITGAMLSPLTGCEKKEKRTNWAGNYEYSTDQVHIPESVEQVQELIKKLNKVKVQGTCHSFNGIADSTANLLSLKNLQKIISLDKDSRRVTVEAGVRYGELCTYLHNEGFAIHNLASLPHISIAGACATATHGSGDQNGNLATAVAALELITSNGELIALDREKDGDKFKGTVVGLGGLGVVTNVTLDIQPAFEMRQYVYQNLPLQQLENHLDEIFSSGYSVSLFTDWKDEYVNQVWIKQRIEDNTSFEPESEFFGAKLAERNLHPIEALSAENCTEQMGMPGASHERLPHFRMDFTPSSGEELQAEYFVPRYYAYEALLEVYKLRELIAPLLQISEVRTIHADNLWMSPCYNQDSVAIHFTWKKDWPGVRHVLPFLEDKLAPFNVRPHWAKLFTIDHETLESRYEKLSDFRQLMTSFDPEGKFRNEYLDRNIFGSQA